MTAAPAVEGAPAPALYARKWDSDASYEPFPQRPPLVPAREALPTEVPTTVARLKGQLEALGWTVRATYAKGYRLGTHDVEETLALRVDGEGGRVAWATWVLGETDAKGVRRGKADKAWAIVPARYGSRWKEHTITAWKVRLGVVPKAKAKGKDVQ